MASGELGFAHDADFCGDGEGVRWRLTGEEAGEVKLRGGDCEGAALALPALLPLLSLTAPVLSAIEALPDCFLASGDADLWGEDFLGERDEEGFLGLGWEWSSK